MGSSANTCRAALVAVSLLVSGSSSADPTELRLASYLPPDHNSTRLIIEPLIAKIDEYSGGTVKVQNFPGGQLATANGTLNAVKSGIANMGLIGVGFVGDLMPLSTIAEVPGVFSDPRKGHSAYWQLVQDTLLEAEFLPNEVHPIMLSLLPQNQLVLAKKIDVNALSDLAGLKVRVPHAVAGDAVSALGMVPVEMAATDLYLALERGTIDGAITQIAAVSAYNLDEVTEAVTTNLSMGSIGFFMVIAESDWQRMTNEQQDAMARAGIEIGTGSVATLVEANDLARNQLGKNGMTFMTLNDTVMAEINAALANVLDTWISTVSVRNELAAEVAQTFVALQSQ
jgi:TRAP-type C4-dicarboxylate transport system substrate-binding protein